MKPIDSEWRFGGSMRSVFVITLLMLLTPWASADVAKWQGPSVAPNSAGNSHSNTSYEGFQIPTNSTITGSEFELAPVWMDSGENGTLWTNDYPGGFSLGQSNGTSYLTSNGDLTLAPISSNGQMTDFESTEIQFSKWTVSGDEIWRPVNLSTVNYGPQSAITGNLVSGTHGNIDENQTGILRSKFWEIPQVVNQFNLSFHRWNSLDSSDISKFQYSINDGTTWQTLSNFTGNSTTWIQETYSLDPLVGSATHIGFRFLISTGSNTELSTGLFLDDFNLSNQGDPQGAWFHGNRTGQYSPNADGSLIVPVNLGNATAPVDLYFWANWDIDGGNTDNLEVLISIDNNSTWNLLSPQPGIPHNGITSGQTVFFEQSYGWREIMMSIPPWLIGNSSISNALLKFKVKTDGSVNHGGSAIEDWEGIMVDDIRIESSVGRPNAQTRNLENFSQSSNSWLVNVSNKANDWQYITWEGNNGPWYNNDSFEQIQHMPAGWRIDHIRGDSPWERGQISSSTNYGPASQTWPSGNNGMGINLDGIYSNEVFTHLVSPQYHIPAGATARLIFNHWICTEQAWDGGAIFTSIDDGITWQHFGGNITGFYDIVSQVNGYSPFYQLGIFDGSRVNGGCGTQNTFHTFTRESGDISYLAGHDVRIRFSFFTDTYVEEDGWYIDDAGIVIDNFQLNGSWTSPLIESDDYGWAKLTSLYWAPNGTSVKADVLDENGSIINGLENRTLPFNLDLPAWKYDKIKFRLHLQTDNETVTPRVRILHHGVTEYLTKDILRISYPETPQWVFGDIGNLPASYTHSIEIESPNWMPYSNVRIDCLGNVSATLHNIPNRIPILGSSPPQPSGNANQIDSSYCGQTLVNPDGPSVASSLRVNLAGGDNFEWIKIEPITLYHPTNVSIDLGIDSVIDYQWLGDFHYTNKLHSLSVDGIPTTPESDRGFELVYNESLEFSILLPSRNVSALSWSCASADCYNGGINFKTNGNKSMQISENYTWINHSGFNHHMVEYVFKFETDELTEFDLFSINYISGFNQTIEINSTLQELFSENGDKTSSLWINIATGRAGVSFDGSIFHEKSIFDTWISTPSETYFPGLTQQAQSNHATLEGTPDLSEINLKVSTSNNLQDTVAEITLDNLETGGRFIQNSGAGVLQLDPSNSSWDGQNVVWSLTSTWLLDDSQRLFWFIESTNSEGFSMGPVVTTSGSSQNSASTNDLEVVRLKSWNNNNSLHDYTNPLWPMKVRGGDEISISGEVRFSGLEGIVPHSDDLDLQINVYMNETIVVGKEASIDEFGQFNISIINPFDKNLSDHQLVIIPEIIRIGSTSSNNARDVTAQYEKITYISDSINSSITKLEVVAPGGVQPADGHVWHLGQDLPLRLHVEDDSGLPMKMQLFTNRSGRAWESQEFLTPIGDKTAIIDLPLIEESSIPLPSEEEGWVDVYIQGTDLSGNPMEGGGSIDQPLARIYLQPRHPTYVEPNSLKLDSHDGYLFPGNNHSLNFSLTDNNGLESIDLVQFDISKEFQGCDAEWQPWNDQVTSDVSCFIKPPIFKFKENWQTSTWDISIEFELRWDIQTIIGESNHTPSLKFFDENAPLGVGLSSISILSWRIHNGIEFKIDNVVDKGTPFGKVSNDVIYIHAQDVVSVNIAAYHTGYNLKAKNLPFGTKYFLEIVGESNVTQREGNLGSSGSTTETIVFDKAFYGSQILMLASLQQVSIQTISGDSFNVVIDDQPPEFTVSSGYLVTLDSNKLSSAQVELRITDDHGLTNESVVMNWLFVRNGRLVEEQIWQDEIPMTFSNIRDNIYSKSVNMEPSFELQKGDYVIVWFNAQDASGHSIEGKGTTSANPIETNIKWVAYEPVIGDIITTPYRPNLGEIVTINFTISNNGLLPGNSSIKLIDKDGIILGQINRSLPVDYSYLGGFEVEAWMEGDLGLEIIVDNQSAIPVPLSSVQEMDSTGSFEDSMMLGLAFTSLFAAGLFLIFVNSRKNNRDNFDEEE